MEAEAEEILEATVEAVVEAVAEAVAETVVEADEAVATLAEVVAAETVDALVGAVDEVTGFLAEVEEEEEEESDRSSEWQPYRRCASSGVSNIIETLEASLINSVIYPSLLCSSSGTVGGRSPSLHGVD